MHRNDLFALRRVERERYRDVSGEDERHRHSAAAHPADAGHRLSRSSVEADERKKNDFSLNSMSQFSSFGFRSEIFGSVRSGSAWRSDDADPFEQNRR